MCAVMAISGAALTGCGDSGDSSGSGKSSSAKADTKLEQTKRNAEEKPDTTDNDIISAISPVIIGAVPKAPDITNDDEIDFDMTDVSGLLSSMVEEF